MGLVTITMAIHLWPCGAGELELELKSRSCFSNTICRNIPTISPISQYMASVD